MKMTKQKKRKAREFYLVLFTNCINEKTGHVYYSKKSANSFNYRDHEIVKVREVLKRKKGKV